MAIECIGLGFSYKRSGIVMFKVMGLGSAMITFVGAIAMVKTSGDIVIFSYTVPTNWFSTVGVAVVFCLVACFYEKFVRPFTPESRTVSGQWFLADSALDVPSGSMAILHVTGAALILLTITIIGTGQQPAASFYFFGGEWLHSLSWGCCFLRHKSK